ncbi:hypothetical protein PR048_021105 [Dryococelus australis]|uniref:Uncharacterized protein n=1 Tax=Dryococelus australis TaxID=614101 RepID=A0ABQ9GX99_9NEOP|nr:hypothetical protein PR048_021105 [Dryococelus australis]
MKPLSTCPYMLIAIKSKFEVCKTDTAFTNTLVTTESLITGSFLFTEKTIMGVLYVGILELYLLLHIKAFQPYIIFQHDGTPLCWSLTIWNVLNEKFPGR